MTDDMRHDHETTLAQVQAPASLRAAVERQVADAARRPGRGPRLQRPRLALAGAGALLLALVLAVVLATGGEDAAVAPPRVQDVAQVALEPATAPAPAERPGGRLLETTSGAIAFPTWTGAGWRATGERTDAFDGGELRTVFYEDADGRRMGYAIADTALPVAGGRLVEEHGAVLRVLTLAGGQQVVTWRRDGQTCILAARDVPLERLVTLASYAA